MVLRRIKQAGDGDGESIGLEFQPPRNGLARIGRVVAAYCAVATCVVWIAETLLLKDVFEYAPADADRRDEFWAPDHGYCRQCGDPLIPMVDELSACRHCTRCNVSYRHKSLPATVEMQEQVWK